MGKSSKGSRNQKARLESIVVTGTSKSVDVQSERRDADAAAAAAAVIELSAGVDRWCFSGSSHSVSQTSSTFYFLGRKFPKTKKNGHLIGGPLGKLSKELECSFFSGITGTGTSWWVVTPTGDHFQFQSIDETCFLKIPGIGPHAETRGSTRGGHDPNRGFFIMYFFAKIIYWNGIAFL